MKRFLLAVLVLISLFVNVLGVDISKAKRAAADSTDQMFVTPAPRQVAYQRMEKIAFAHFGVNTFTDREWGTGDEDPAIFNPTNFDAEQWVRVLKENGFKELILTAKHHDGFCLWPSKYTDHDVASSPWKNGKGDVVKEVSDACHKYGLKFGIYLSPWDRHEPSYGTDKYNQFYLNQLRELLTNYGKIYEVWFDGAKGPNAKDMEYDFKAYRALVRKLQPQAVLFSDEGPDVHWIGNENGIAGKTNWSKLDPNKVAIGKPGQGEYLQHGDPNGTAWIAGECDVSIRPGWFYHQKEDSKVKSIAHLLDIYYKSVGRNGTMLLNIPPDKEGRFNEHDVKRLNEFTSVLRRTFSENLARNASIKYVGGKSNGEHSAENLLDDNWNTYWTPSGDEQPAELELETDYPVLTDRIVLQEYIKKGQRVNQFKIEAEQQGKWVTVAEGTTIGYKRILRIDPITAKKFRISLKTRKGAPVLNEIGLYKASKKEDEVYDWKKWDEKYK